MKKINKVNFKKTLSTFATGITVVATKNNSILYGKTINSFSSLSLSPPLVLFSLDKKSTKLKIFRESKTISINILSNKQEMISNNFAKKNPNWKEIDYAVLENGNALDLAFNSSIVFIIMSSTLYLVAYNKLQNKISKK